MERIFIIGTIGFDKMGAECLLTQMIHNLRQDHPGVHLGVLSDNPGKTARLGVEAVPRQDMKVMWEAVEDCDSVIWLRSEHSLDWRTLGLEVFLVRLAKWRKKHIHSYRTLSNVSASGWMSQQAEHTFNRCDQKVVFSLGYDDKEPHPLLQVRRAKSDGLRHLQDEGIHLAGRPVAFCLDRQTALMQVDQVAVLADTLMDEGASLLFMPVDHFADMEAANQVLERMNHSAPVMRKAYTAQEWIDILGDTQSILTTYPSVQAMSHALDVPCIELDEQTLDSLPIDKLLYRQK